MTVPTISGLSPIAGHTGGKTLVHIGGSGFRIPTQRAAVRGITPPPLPSVRVLFGTTEAEDVLVFSDAKIYAVSPIHDPGSVDITVTNIDDSGNPIAGETVVRARAFAFQRPDLMALDTDLQRVVRTFIQELQRQILPNVNWPAAVDYDDDTGDDRSVTKLAEVPAIILAEVMLRENNFYAVRENVEVPNPDGTSTETRPPTTVDIVFTLVGVSNTSRELLGLTSAMKGFFRKNAYLYMARDANDASNGKVRYELDSHETPDIKLTLTANNSDMKHYAMTAAIIGFDLEGIQGLPLGGPGQGVPDHEQVVSVDPPADTVTASTEPRNS